MKMDLVYLNYRELTEEAYFTGKWRLNNIVDEIVTHLKEIHGTLKLMESKVERLVLHRKGNNNNNLLYMHEEAKDEDAFKWYTQFKEGTPIECNFRLCKGTLSTFNGSKGLFELLPCSGQEAERYHKFDVIKMRAEKIPNVWPANYDWDSFSDTFYSYLLQKRSLICYYLIHMTSDADLHALEKMIDLELESSRKLEETRCRACQSTLSFICEKNAEYVYYTSWIECAEKLTGLKKEFIFNLFSDETTRKTMLFLEDSVAATECFSTSPEMLRSCIRVEEKFRYYAEKSPETTLKMSTGELLDKEAPTIEKIMEDAKIPSHYKFFLRNLDDIKKKKKSVNGKGFRLKIMVTAMDSWAIVKQTAKVLLQESSRLFVFRGRRLGHRYAP